MSNVLRVAIVGSGPAGMYALEHLLEERGLEVEVDLYERLPSPYGLVRAGVAPDHPEKKLVADRLFSYFLARSNVRFFGNVEVGKDIRHQELADWYDAVIYAVGASSDTPMGIPGEELEGCWAGREFVAWYNGHPDFEHLEFDLSSKRAVIVGNGNVALDIARILTLPIAELEKTDIADYALQALRASQVKEVLILGRRGHMQAAFNNPELEELEHLDGVDVLVDDDEFPHESEVIMDDADWQTRRKVATLSRLANLASDDSQKRITFRFLTSPIELLGNDKLEKVLVVRNHLERDDKGNLSARPTEEESLIDTGQLFRAIGYRGHPFPGLPFDDRKGVFENINGRIHQNGEAVPGSYVTGWIKRGPKGVIGTNKRCADETVACLLEDYHAGRLTRSLNGKAVYQEVRSRVSSLVELNDWLKVDREEKSRGKAFGRQRVKITNTAEMLRVAQLTTLNKGY